MIKRVRRVKINNFLQIVLVFILLACENEPQKLPYIGNFDVEYRNENGKVYTDTIYPRIPLFKFQNENGKWVSNKDFVGRIWVVEFFFATCPTICPIMTSELKRLNQDVNALEQHIQFLSFTINPNNDTPEVLSNYKKKNGITAKNWAFLRGEETETHRLGIENFQTFAGRDDEAEGGYAHSGSFTLVDKEGYVRGVYAVTGYDGSVNLDEYNRLKQDINTLLKYEYNINIP
jgi:protein SCO1